MFPTVITLFLIHSHPAMRAVLRLRLELETDITVIGEAGNDDHSGTWVATLAPDVIILDVMTPIPDQTGASLLLLSVPRTSAIIVLSLYDDPMTRLHCLAAGATAVISKHGPDDLLLAAIRSAAASVHTPSPDTV